MWGHRNLQKGVGICWILLSTILRAMTMNLELLFVFAFRAKVLMRRRSALVVVLVMSVVFALLNIHVFFVYEMVPSDDSTTSTQCVVKAKHVFMDGHITPWIDMALFALLPSLVICIGNLIIVYRLCQSRKIGALQSGNTEVQKSIYRIIPMLLLVTTVFVVCTIPLGVFYVGKSYFFSLIAWFQDSDILLSTHEGISEERTALLTQFCPTSSCWTKNWLQLPNNLTNFRSEN